MMSIYARIASLGMALLAVAALLWYVHNHGDRQGAARVQSAWNEAKLAQNEVIQTARIAADKRMSEANEKLSKPAPVPSTITEIIHHEKINPNCRPSDELVRLLNLQNAN